MSIARRLLLRWLRRAPELQPKTKEEEHHLGELMACVQSGLLTAEEAKDQWRRYMSMPVR